MRERERERVKIFNIKSEKQMTTTSFPRVTKLYTTVVGWNDPEKALSLIKEGSDPNDPPFLLSRAIQLRKLKCAKVLIQNGANVNAYSGNGVSGDSSMSSGQGNNHESPLHGAVRIGSLEIVKLLVERGANINHKEFRALDYAAGLGHSNMVKYFIQKGEDVNSRTANGETPLFFAITNGHLNVVRILVKNGANVNAKVPPYYFSKITTIFYAACTRHMPSHSSL